MANHAKDSGAMLDAAQTHALALAMYNSVAAQQQGAIVRQASTTMVCAAMLSLGIAETAESQPQPPTGDAAAPQPAPVAAALTGARDEVPAQALAADPAEWSGQAYQSVAQSAAIAIQDAADYLRNVTTIATTAAGVAMAQYLANPAGAEQYRAVMAETQKFVAAAMSNFETIGVNAEKLLKHFPRR